MASPAGGLAVGDLEVVPMSIPMGTDVPRLERNMLEYAQGQILIARRDSEIVGAVRTAQRTADERRHGLIVDLQVDPAEVRSAVGDALLSAAEGHLHGAGVTRIDALVRDGVELGGRLIERGYWASRKSIVMRFDLTADVAPSPAPPGTTIDRATAADVPALIRLVMASYQPYWRWWREGLADRRWDRVEFPAADATPISPERTRDTERLVGVRLAAILASPQAAVFTARAEGRIVGLCDASRDLTDDQLDFGVLILRDSGGRGLGSALLGAALGWLREGGLDHARATTTSGLDDYDPTVYLYNLAYGAAIEAELVDFVKHPISRRIRHAV